MVQPIGLYWPDQRSPWEQWITQGRALLTSWLYNACSTCYASRAAARPGPPSKKGIGAPAVPASSAAGLSSPAVPAMLWYSRPCATAVAARGQVNRTIGSMGYPRPSHVIGVLSGLNDCVPPLRLVVPLWSSPVMPLRVTAPAVQ
jgi:hypothetical protein